MKNASMSGAIALVGIGLITIGLGNFLGNPEAHAVSAANQVGGQPAMIGIAIDDSRSSGRWNKTLLAVDSSGKVYALDTKAPKVKWAPFIYSP
ncbi:MAG: hypothetical protein MK100_09780 [Phycisphaerales bacterium]|nr:hypothetical protein [Phycisphaerales bacterium]